MIILEKPYVSDLLQKTIIELGLPVLRNKSLEEIISPENMSQMNTIDESGFVNTTINNNQFLTYTNSENSINWVTNNLVHTQIPDKIRLFKDKISFRNLIKNIYPDFFFKEVDFDNLKGLDITNIKKPFIIKPAVGFISIGVYKVDTNEEWSSIIMQLQDEIACAKNLYPTDVINPDKFIIEEYIEGTELAVDAYFTPQGKPVILNILEHPFSSSKDVGDRVYFTSKKIISENLERISTLLSLIGDLSDIKSFPLHIELRVDKNNRLIPIEINPMRFCGWCTTDIAYYAYGINIYDYYFNQKQPDWEQIFKNIDDEVYSFVIAEIPKDIEFSKIKGIDYESFMKNFSNILNFRRIDYYRYPIFAIVFTKIECGFEEVDNILKKDIREYIIL